MNDNICSGVPVRDGEKIFLRGRRGEEFFYRPALRRFSPSPDGLFDTSDPEKPYKCEKGQDLIINILSQMVLIPVSITVVMVWNSFFNNGDIYFNNESFKIDETDVFGRGKFTLSLKK